MSIFFIPYSMGSISVRYLFMTIFSFPMYVTFLLGRFEITSAPEQDRYPDRCTCLFIFFFLLSSLFPNSQNSFIESAAVIYWESTFFVVVGGAKSTRRHQQNRLVSVSWMWHGPTSGHRCKTKRKCEPPLFFGWESKPKVSLKRTDDFNQMEKILHNVHEKKNQVTLQKRQRIFIKFSLLDHKSKNL